MGQFVGSWRGQRQLQGLRGFVAVWRQGSGMFLVGATWGISVEVGEQGVAHTCINRVAWGSRGGCVFRSGSRPTICQLFLLYSGLYI